MAYLLEFTGKVRVYSGFLVTSLGIEKYLRNFYFKTKGNERELCKNDIIKLILAHNCYHVN